MGGLVRQVPVVGRRCGTCGSVIDDRTRARYCSNACRQRAYRMRATSVDLAPVIPAARSCGELPASLDSFVGRRPEIERIRQLFRRHRLVTLIGPAGVGKSRLAVEFAHRRFGAHSGAVTLVQLDPVGDGDQVAGAVANALGVSERPGTPITETLLAALRTSRATLLLDDCEHLVRPCAELVATALRRCGGLRVLATSREALDIPGEAVFEIVGLPATRSEGPPPAVQRPADAVRLFADRAAALVHDFRITQDNAADIAAICAELDGNPLAIELAARWVPVLPVGHIRARLARRFELLTTNRRSAHARRRQRSLREAIDHGYELLSHDERVVFRRLSVLSGGFDLTTATAVCADSTADADRVCRLLGRLQATSLLARTGEPGRFRQLESIRLYARERLAAAGETEATRDRLLDRLAVLAEPLIRAPLSFSLAAERAVESMADSLVAATGWATAPGDRRRTALTVAAVRSRLNRGRLTEARTLLDAALAEPGGHPEDRCLLLSYAGCLAALQSDPDTAVRLPRTALEQARSLAAPVAEACARYALGTGHQAAGHLDAADEHLSRCAAQWADELGQPAAAAVVRQRLAWTALVRGDTSRAATLVTDVLATLADRPPVFAISRILCTAGAVALSTGEHGAAAKHFTETVRATPDRWLHVPFALEGLGVLAQREGRATQAVRLFGAAGAIRPTDRVHVDSAWRRRVADSAGLARRAAGGRCVESITGEIGRLTRRQLVTYALDDEEIPRAES